MLEKVQSLRAQIKRKIQLKSNENAHIHKRELKEQEMSSLFFTSFSHFLFLHSFPIRLTNARRNVQESTEAPGTWFCVGSRALKEVVNKCLEVTVWVVFKLRSYLAVLFRFLMWVPRMFGLYGTLFECSW